MLLLKFGVSDFEVIISLLFCLMLSNLILYPIIKLIHPSLWQRYGVWGDWENPYLTLNPDYEAAQVRVSTPCFKFSSLLEYLLGMMDLYLDLHLLMLRTDWCIRENVSEWSHLPRSEACTLESIVWNCACRSRA